MSDSSEVVALVVHKMVQRWMDDVLALVAKHPEYRGHICYGALGAVVGMCDSFGVDVEGFLTKLRTVTPKPPVLIPPDARRS